MYCSLQCAFYYGQSLYVLELILWQFGEANHYMYCSLQFVSLL
jgi:hypothetical protein